MYICHCNLQIYYSCKCKHESLLKVATQQSLEIIFFFVAKFRPWHSDEQNVVVVVFNIDNHAMPKIFVEMPQITTLSNHNNFSLSFNIILNTQINFFNTFFTIQEFVFWLKGLPFISWKTMFCKNKTPNQGVWSLYLVISTKEDLFLLLFIGLKNKLSFYRKGRFTRGFSI